ncbi:hypothetical protein [Poseidonocella sp. HB161398]|uniref:hypothetical protein n=1 Tax=Poseidonocella sp. HB161398 TaxID=2320855 RepID=UPI001107AA31|nr:hypothetical protein [Poseidonocella sp. HB161398]
MINKFAFAAFALAASGAAVAAQANDQLARSLGIDTGAYSSTQLVQLRKALEEGDSQRVSYIVDGPAMGGVTASDQLAASLNVEPGTYTAAELVALKGAVEDDNVSRAAYVTGANQVTSRDSATAGSQLSRSLGATSDAGTAALAAAYLEETGRGDD